MNQTAITLLQINDTHGYLEPHPELFWQGDKAEYRTSGGYSRLLTIFKKVRQERNGAVIALDNGDTFHGTYYAVESSGEELKRYDFHTVAFVTTQGVPKKYGRKPRDLGLHAIDVLKRYCAAHTCVNADLRGTVIAV